MKLKIFMPKNIICVLAD